MFKYRKISINNIIIGKSWDECNVEDSEANGMAKVPLIVARYAGYPDLATTIESMVHILLKPKLSVECSLVVGKLSERILFK